MYAVLAAGARRALAAWWQLLHHRRLGVGAGVGEADGLGVGDAVGFGVGALVTHVHACGSTELSQ